MIHMTRIFVLNPNSSLQTTQAMEAGARGVIERLPGVTVEFDTLAEGPAAIETQADVEQAAFPVLARLRNRQADASVIGCFSDPGLHLCRSELGHPVIGIGEAAYAQAVGFGVPFGIVSIVQASLGRHLRQVRSLGYKDFLAGDRSLDLGVAGLADPDRAMTRLIEVGSALRDRDGAQVLILGCASMGVYRPAVEAELGLPVIDPVQAAIVRAHALLVLGYPGQIT